MKKNISNILKIIAKPLLGRGIVDRYFPFLIVIFQTLYGKTQGNSIKTVDLQDNLKLKVFSGDIGVGLPLLTKGYYEKHSSELFLSLLGKGSVVLDIGANVGYYSVIASKKVGETGSVYSFEPDPDNASLLRENVDLNNLKNVSVVEKALSDKTETTFFKSEKFNKGESSLAKNGIEVQAIKLDDFIKDQGIKKVDLIKMDIEGAEIMALRGGAHFLKNSNVMLVIEYNPSSIRRFGYQPEEMIKQIEDLGFEIDKIVDEQNGSIITYNPDSLKQVLGHTTYCNLLAKK